MIELNCTYEESKKILELGYDFSKVCWKTGYYWDKAYLEHTHGTGLLLETQAYRISYLNDHKGDTRDHTPIIPKAALEACLITCIVDCEQKRIFYLSYDRHKKPIYRLNYETPIKTIDTIYTEYESAYEAFLWCHENYSEELKAKFNEVMA